MASWGHLGAAGKTIAKQIAWEVGHSYGELLPLSHSFKVDMKITQIL